MKPLPWWVQWVALVAVGIAAYSVGRWATAPEIEIRTEYRTEWRTRVEVQEVVRWRERVVERRVTDRRVETTDAGTIVVERIDERTRTDRAEDTDTDTRAESEGEARVVRTETPVPPQWRVGVDVGAGLRDPLVRIYGPVVVGARVDRRIAGPIWIGAWAGTHGAAGLSLSGEF